MLEKVFFLNTRGKERKTNNGQTGSPEHISYSKPQCIWNSRYLEVDVSKIIWMRVLDHVSHRIHSLCAN